MRESSFDLVVSPRTDTTGQTVQDAVVWSGGSIYRLDPAANTFTKLLGPVRPTP